VNWFQSMSAYIVTDFILRLPLIGLTLILVMFPVASPPAVWITESWFPDSTLRLRRRTTSKHRQDCVADCCSHASAPGGSSASGRHTGVLVF
jgi:hypothetical protein